MRITSVAVLAVVVTLTICNIAKAVPKSYIRPQLPPKIEDDPQDRLGNSARLLPRDYDPDVLADQVTWDKFVLKGGALMCAMKNSDKFAGEWLNDARNPPSAASVWQGDLTREFDLRARFQSRIVTTDETN